MFTSDVVLQGKSQQVRGALHHMKVCRYLTATLFPPAPPPFSHVRLCCSENYLLVGSKHCGHLGGRASFLFGATSLCGKLTDSFPELAFSASSFQCGLCTHCLLKILCNSSETDTLPPQ